MFKSIEAKDISFEDIQKAFESVGIEDAEFKHIGNGIYRGQRIYITDKGLEMLKRALDGLLCDNRETVTIECDNSDIGVYGPYPISFPSPKDITAP